MTATVADTARYLDAVVGPDDTDCMTLPPPGVTYEDIIETLNVEGLRAAWSDDLGYLGVDPEMVRICRKSAEGLIEHAKLELRGVSVKLPSIYGGLQRLMIAELRSKLAFYGFYPDRANEMTGTIRERLKVPDPDPAELFQINQMLLDFHRKVAALFCAIDVLITPTTSCPAFSATGPTPTQIGGRDVRESGVENFSLIGNVCWNPSISVPAGTTAGGLPVGIIITGPRHRDDIVLRLARIQEQLSPWPRMPI